jgi:hypothetical protein
MIVTICAVWDNHVAENCSDPVVNKQHQRAVMVHRG